MYAHFVIRDTRTKQRKRQAQKGLSFTLVIDNLNGNDVHRTELTAVSGIRLGFECNLLSLFQCAESLRLNHRVVDKNIVTTCDTVCKNDKELRA